MPPPDMPPSIQKPQKSSPISARTRRISVSVYRLPAHGMMVWMGPSKLRWVQAPMAADVAVLQVPHHLVENADGFLPPAPLGLGAQQVFLRHHLQDGADVLRHPAVHQHQALLELLAGLLRHLGQAEDSVIGQQAAAADAEFGIALLRAHAVNQLDARPHAARILPAAARARQPLAQNRARGHQAPVVLFHAAGERVNLAGGAHAHGDQASQQAGGYGQARALGNVVHLADDFDAVARPCPSAAPARRPAAA